MKTLVLVVTVSLYLPQMRENLALSKKSVEVLLLISVASRFHSRNSTDEFNGTLDEFDHRFLTVVQHFLQRHKPLKAVMPFSGGCSLSCTVTAALVV